MLRGLYTATSGMIAQQRQQEALSNNIANMTTPGYKSDKTVMKSFPEMLIHQLDSQTVPTIRGLKKQGDKQVGSLVTGTYVQETIPNFIEGALRETSMSTDLAISNERLPEEDGVLLFSVADGDGEVRYTRNGNFTVDGEGFLTTNEGYYVLDNNGNQIQPNSYDFTVSKDGQVTGDNVNTALGVVYFANSHDLVKGEDNNFNLEGDSQPEAPGIADATFELQQGFLEQSNVDPQLTMTKMMEAYRAFEQNQQVLKIYDDSLGRAVNEIGSLR